MGRPPKVQPPRRPNPLTNLKPIRNPPPIGGRKAAPIGNIARKALTGATKARRLCPNQSCTSPKIEDGVCVTCGTIVTDSNIVAEVQFGENSSGAAVVQGSFVSADQGTAKSLGPAFRRAGGQEDGEKTLREGTRIMRGFAAIFVLREEVVNHGIQIFKLAIGANFIQGRRMGMVAACCLYTSARQMEKCRVMLIDFADVCGVNVFKLGHCFKALHKTITLYQIKPLLPEDLIYRFASKLEFGEDTERVAVTAIRLSQRMAVDWMVMGRRPSGVCGACLIMAARMHNFRRTVKEVVYIVKVTTHTIQKRLDEFKFTASSDLTVEEFLGNQFLESAHDPPSFYEKSEEFQAQKRSRKRKRPLELEEDDEGEDEAVDTADTPGPEQSQQLASEPEANSVLTSLASQLQQVPAPNFTRDKDGFLVPPPPPPKNVPIDPALLDDTDESTMLESLASQHGDALNDAEIEAQPEAPSPTKRGPGRPSTRPSTVVPLTIDAEWEADEADIESDITEMISDPHSLEHTKAFETARQRAKLHVMIANAKKPQRNVPMTVAIEDDEFANDPEVENCLLSEAETAIKEQIWVNDNKEWLRNQQQKLFKQKMAAMGPPKATRKRKKKPRIGEGQLSAADSPADAAEQVAKSRFWSKKINYNVIRNLFNDDDQGSASASAGTSRVTSRAGSTVAQSDAASSIVGDSDAATSSAAAADVGNSLIGELDDDDGDDLDNNWMEEMDQDD